MIRVGVLDQLTPAAARWLEGMGLAAEQGLLAAGGLIRDAAVRNVSGRVLGRSGRNRTKGPHRGIRVGVAGGRGRIRRSAGILSVDVWPSQGLLAPHELGSTTRPHPILARKARTLRFIGRDGAVVFRRQVQHPGMTLPRRPWLTLAYQETAPAAIARIEAEYARLFAEGQALRSASGG